MRVYINEVKDEALPISINQQSHFEAQSISKSNDIKDNLNKWGMAIEQITNSIIQSTIALIEASQAIMETTTNVTRECLQIQIHIEIMMCGAC